MTDQLLLDAMTEAQLQACLVEAAERGGWLIFHDYDSRRNIAGFPDLVLVRDGCIRLYECKTTKGKVRPEQQRWLTELKTVQAYARTATMDRGGAYAKPVVVEVVRPADLARITNELIVRPRPTLREIEEQEVRDAKD